MLALLLATAIAATTYTAPPPVSSRTDWSTNHYAEPREGLVAVDLVSPDINDVTLSTGTDLAGYLERIVYSHDGNDTSWKLSVQDASGVTLWSTTDANALNDPNSYAVSQTDADASGTKFCGVPFVGGLSVVIADANQAREHYAGDGNNVTVRLYIREAWRR